MALTPHWTVEQRQLARQGLDTCRRRLICPGLVPACRRTDGFRRIKTWRTATEAARGNVPSPCVVVEYGVADANIDVPDPDTYLATAAGDCLAAFLQHVEKRKGGGSTAVARAIVDLLLQTLER